MKTKLLVIMVLGFAAVASYGFLEFNNVDIDLQSLGVMSSVESFSSGFNCACSDPDLPQGGFNSGNCDVRYLVEPSDGPDGIHGTSDDIEGVAHPDSLGLVGNMLCLWESNHDDYGGLLDGDYEGCEAKSWMPKSTDSLLLWPPEYNPNDQFNDVFLTTFPATFYENDEEEEDRFFRHFKEDNRLFEYFDNEKEFFKYIKNNGEFLKYFTDKKGNLKEFKSDKNFFNYHQHEGGFMNYFDDKKDFFKYLKNNDEFWKHFKDKKGYKPKSFTLEDALKSDRTWKDYPYASHLAKEATAAILNSAHNDIDYPYSVQEVIRMTQDSIINSDHKETTKLFTSYNKLGDSVLCP